MVANLARGWFRKCEKYFGIFAIQDSQKIEIASMSKADAENPEKLKQSYKDTFEMFLRNAKTQNKNGITGVTFWGLNDGVTWLNVPSNGQLRWLNNVHQYPLIFDENLNTKPAFYGVLEAAE